MANFQYPGGGAGSGGGAISAIAVKTADYTLVAGDTGTLFVMNSTSPHTFQLPGTVPAAGWSAFLQNENTGAVTVDRNGHNIDDAAGNLTLYKGEGILVGSNGSNYYTERGLLPTLTGDISLSGLAATVVALQGVSVATTAPTDQQYLHFNNGTSKWEPTTLTLIGKQLGNVTPTDQQVLTYDNGSGKWIAQTITVPPATGGVVSKSIDYTLGSGDGGKLVVQTDGADHTFKLPAVPPSSTWSAYIENIAGGRLAVVPNGLTLDGGAGISLFKNQGIYVTTDGTNYFTSRGYRVPATVSVTFGDGTVAEVATDLWETIDNGDPQWTGPGASPACHAAALAQHGVVIGDDGAGRVKTVTPSGSSNKVLHDSASGDPTMGPVVEGDLSLTDITTANVSTSKHGFAPKLPNDATKFLDGTGAYSVPGGGGGGSINAGTPLLPCNRFSSNDNNFAGDSIWGYFYGSQLTNLPANWKVRLGCVGGTGVHVAAAVVYRTLANDLTVTDVTVITFGSSPTYNSAFSGATLASPFFVTSDSISVVLDDLHDYYVVFYFDSDGSGFNAALHLPRTYLTQQGYLFGNFQSGDKTGTTVSSALTPPANGADGVFWDVVAA